MKNSIKNAFLIGGLTMASSLSSQAALVYTSDFSAGYTSSGTGAHLLGGASPDVTATDWFGSTNGINLTGGDITFANSTQNRLRGAGVWLDTTGWTAGLVTVGINATTYTAGADTNFLFQAYAANGVDASNSVSLDLHGSANGAVSANTGTATIAALGAEQYVTAAGSNSFTFTFNGTDQFVGLVFAQENIAGGSTFGSADLDNLTVNTTDPIPEPSSTALLGLGGLALILRRRK